MTKPKNKQELIDYCLRKLGQPVINVNVSPDQCDDRIDEALETYYEKHYDATEDTWVVYHVNELDVQNGYITVPDDILMVNEAQPVSGLFGGGGGIFSYQYQVAVGALSSWQIFDMTDYSLRVMNYTSTMDTINPDTRYEFVRHKNKLRFYDNLKLVAGESLGFRVIKLIDPDDATSMYNDKWLKEYSTALIKRQWGENMKKFGEVQMLGGVTINGQQIFQEALDEIQQLEETLEEVYQLPASFFVG